MSGFGRVVRMTAFVVTSGAAIAATPASDPSLPHGWRALLKESTDYSISADRSHRDGGQGTPGVTIKSIVPSPAGSAVLVQSIRADDYRGHRVRLSGYVKTANINEGSGAMWMQVEGDGLVQRSDFMQNRPLHGTSDWQRQEIVLDVPLTAVGISFGAALDGSGQLWVDDFSLEIVGDEVATTGRDGGLWKQDTDAATLERLRRQQETIYRRAPTHPVNLDFRSE